MIPELGHFALVLALAMALVQSSVPVYGALKGQMGGVLHALALTTSVPD